MDTISVRNSRVVLLGRLLTGVVNFNFAELDHRTVKRAGTGLTGYGASGMQGTPWTLELLANSADEGWLAGLVEREKKGFYISWYGSIVYATGERAEMVKGQIITAPGGISVTNDGGENTTYQFDFEEVNRDFSGLLTANQVVAL